MAFTALAAAVPGWALLIAPYVNDPALSTGQLLVSAAYPVADLILLPLILRLVFLHRARITAHLFLLLGMLAYLVAEMTGRRLVVLGAASMLAPAVILLTAGVNVEIVRIAAISTTS